MLSDSSMLVVKVVSSIRLFSNVFSRGHQLEYGYFAHILSSRLYGHTYSKSMDQQGMVANPACGQIAGKMNISLSAFAPENLVSRDGFGSPVPRQPSHLHTQAESSTYLRDSSRVRRRRPYI